MIRAVQWTAVAVTGWSLSLPWGVELAVGKGPPAQWERHIVGAVLLLMVAALASSFTARKNKKPGSRGLMISAAGAFGALALALTIRSTSMDNQQTHVLLGGGWMWMISGCMMSVGAVISVLALRVFPTKPVTLIAKPNPAPKHSARNVQKKRKKKKR